MLQLRTILLTTDFSKTSVRAFPAAIGFARRFGARILVVHVEDDRLSPLLGEYMAVGLESLRQRQVEHARGQLEELVREHLQPDLDVETEVRLGVPHAEIISFATERAADLLVMATHGRGVISHAFMGSTTERVLRRAPCPVLVVRVGGTEAGSG